MKWECTICIFIIVCAVATSKPPCPQRKDSVCPTLTNKKCKPSQVQEAHCTRSDDCSCPKVCCVTNDCKRTCVVPPKSVIQGRSGTSGKNPKVNEPNKTTDDYDDEIPASSKEGEMLSDDESEGEEGGEEGEKSSNSTEAKGAGNVTTTVKPTTKGELMKKGIPSGVSPAPVEAFKASNETTEDEEENEAESYTAAKSVEEKQEIHNTLGPMAAAKISVPLAFSSGNESQSSKGPTQTLSGGEAESKLNDTATAQASNSTTPKPVETTPSAAAAAPPVPAASAAASPVTAAQAATPPVTAAKASTPPVTAAQAATPPVTAAQAAAPPVTAAQAAAPPVTPAAPAAASPEATTAPPEAATATAEAAAPSVKPDTNTTETQVTIAPLILDDTIRNRDVVVQLMSLIPKLLRNVYRGRTVPPMVVKLPSEEYVYVPPLPGYDSNKRNMGRATKMFNPKRRALGLPWYKYLKNTRPFGPFSPGQYPYPIFLTLTHPGDVFNRLPEQTLPSLEEFFFRMYPPVFKPEDEGFVLNGPLSGTTKKD